jgi:DNA-binding XRE family transcriptional regulator
MAKKKTFSESDLAALAKQWRTKAGKRKAEVARELRIARVSVQLAENNPEQSLTKLRIRIIESCSPYRVCGPAYRLEPKQ